MLIRLLALTTLVLMAPAALADWKLVDEDSRLSFASIKQGSIAETHHFKRLTGNIADSGAASIAVPLATVETDIPIRNERMQKLLFDTAKHARASVTAQVDIAELEALEPGQTTKIDTDLQLSIRGTGHTESAQLQVTMLKDGRLLVSTVSPVMLNAADYQLLEGIEKLRQIAGLDSISPVVPVTVKLVFERS